MNKRVIIGALFLLIGAVLTLDNLDILDFDLPRYVFRWHTFLIVIGIFMATVREKVGFGITLIIVGGVFLLQSMADYYWWDYDFRDIFRLWPLVFVAIGASLILKKANHKEYEKKKTLTETSTSLMNWPYSEELRGWSPRSNSKAANSLQFLEEQI